jgi:hypothetical protein
MHTTSAGGATSPCSDALATIQETSFESERSPGSRSYGEQYRATADNADNADNAALSGIVGGSSSSRVMDDHTTSRGYSDANQLDHRGRGGSSGDTGGGALTLEQSTLLEALEASRCEVGVLEERVRQLEEHCGETDLGKSKLMQQLQQLHVSQSEPTERLKLKLKSSQREVKDYELYKEVSYSIGSISTTSCTRNVWLWCMMRGVWHTKHGV